MCNSGFVCVLCHPHLFVTMYITFHRIIILPLPFLRVGKGNMFLALQVYWRFYYLFLMLYEYKEASKQHLFNSAITLVSDLLIFLNFCSFCQSSYHCLACSS